MAHVLARRVPGRRLIRWRSGGRRGRGSGRRSLPGRCRHGGHLHADGLSVRVVSIAAHGRTGTPHFHRRDDRWPRRRRHAVDPRRCKPVEPLHVGHERLADGRRVPLRVAGGDGPRSTGPVPRRRTRPGFRRRGCGPSACQRRRGLRLRSAARVRSLKSQRLQWSDALLDGACDGRLLRRRHGRRGLGFVRPHGCVRGCRADRPRLRDRRGCARWGRRGRCARLRRRRCGRGDLWRRR